MCGIAGFLSAGPLAAGHAHAELERMTAALEHRGPDDKGRWVGAAAGIALGHRRLSIVDLSPLGHQPMVSESGRFVITLNGEIYNYRTLAQELLGRGHRFRGSSDTEVLVAAIEEWGVDGALDRAHGMFAFGVWDCQKRELYLARDRFGEKPLYYSVFPGRAPGLLMFASELKALRAHSEWSGDIDRGSLALMLRHGFVPAPHTVFSNTHKLRPGCVLTLRARGQSFDMSEREYWQPKALAASGRGRNAEGAAEQVEHVHTALTTAIRQQMVADVPLGAFLSGGIDSSLIVSLMQRESSRPVRTFSIGFTEERYNEAPYAKRIAQHLGTDHTELLVTPAEARAVIPRLPQIYDEPFGDSSQIPTYLVCELARKRVTVALSGDAADELFGGYSRYTMVPAHWQRVRVWPPALRRAAAALVNSLSTKNLQLALGPAGRLRARPDYADRLQQRARGWQAQSFAEFCHTATSVWPLPDQCVLGATEPMGLAGEWAHPADELAHMMYVDTRVYLPDDILVKVDRAAMAVSLETRVPFLDAEVAEAAWRIDPATHRRDGRGKWILRQILERFVPRAFFERPKKGFAVPVDQWMRHELRGWAEDLLDTATLRRQGFFDADLIERRWRQHLSGRANWQYQLWSVLMFQSWLAAWGSSVPAPKSAAACG
jgi:asparagine synthase (glutamine-hydrolysing)